MRAITQTLNTNGTGLWSKEVREVQVVGLILRTGSYDNDDGSKHVYGELRVKFDASDWDTQVHGLIYTDPQFLAELKDFLARAKYDVTNIGYSECGMQGDDYVSLDVDAGFINSWNVTK